MCRPKDIPWKSFVSYLGLLANGRKKTLPRRYGQRRLAAFMVDLIANILLFTCMWPVSCLSRGRRLRLNSARATTFEFFILQDGFANSPGKRPFTVAR